MMTTEQARILIELLEAATDCNWPNVASEIVNRGYWPEEVCAAWRELEKMADMSGMAAHPSEF
jgi:hypothetical protein